MPGARRSALTVGASTLTIALYREQPVEQGVKCSFGRSDAGEAHIYVYIALDNSPIAMSKCTDIQYTE